jgi:hypothetical protein
MSRDPRELPECELHGPPPEARERVLAACRAALATRLAAERRRRAVQPWGFAAAVAALLLVNVVEERRTGRQIAALRAGPVTMAQAPGRDAAAVGSLRARASLLASLLRDPDAL